MVLCRRPPTPAEPVSKGHPAPSRQGFFCLEALPLRRDRRRA
jgi:hypothetical protein